MTALKRRLAFSVWTRRRPPRLRDDPADVFRTFVHVLAQMQAHARNASPAGEAEKG
jgi:hypothetical protein